MTRFDYLRTELLKLSCYLRIIKGERIRNGRNRISEQGYYLQADGGDIKREEPRRFRASGAKDCGYPAYESNELRLDNLFLLSDGSLAIIDYESSFSRENFVKYLNYIARVIRRFAVRRELKDLKQLKMVVIYTADVERAEERYDLGGLILIVESAYLIHLDGSQIYDRLKHKIDAGEKLAEEELMELMILPLTVKGKKRKQETIEKAVTLGKRLPDREGQLKVIAGILTFTDKVIDRAYAKKLEEEMQMTLVGQMLMDEGYQRGMEKGMEKGIQVFIQDNVSENVPEQRIIQKLQAN